MSRLTLVKMVFVLLVGGSGCWDDRSGTAPQGSPASALKGSSPQDLRTDSRFIQIRDLLRQDPDAPARATRLYALVEPVCADVDARRGFLDTLAWSASFSDKKYRMTVVYALDTLEHVATSCARNHLKGALELVAGAARVLKEEARVFVIKARILAADGQFGLAENAARRAKDLGHVHAIALTAHIQARRAREAEVGYRPGMLDAALKTVMEEPTAEWALIDLEAVLVTRAQLLLERAVWEPPPVAIETETEAQEVLRRLSVAPFEKNARRHALDALCFFAVQQGRGLSDPCGRAAREMHNLGAAAAVGVSMTAESFEVERYQGLTAVRETLDEIRDEDTVLVVLRGDESELLEWVRPAIHVLGRVAGTGVRVVVVNRTRTARARALVNRVVQRASLRPVLRLDAGKETLVMPCIAAVVANRRTPSACPLEPAAQARLARLKVPRLSFLIGRDLDSEIDDLKLYNLPTVLMSIRDTRYQKTLAAWLKSQADAFVVVSADASKPGVPRSELP